MGKSSTPTCCLTLPLKLEKWQADCLEKRFEIARQLYNTYIRAALKRYNQMRYSEKYSKEYFELQKIIAKHYKNKTNKDEECQIALKRRGELLKEYNLTEYGFLTAAKEYYKYFKDNIASSVAVHGIAAQAWTAFDSLLFEKGKRVHFKRKGDLRSVRGGSNSSRSGGTEIMFRGDHIEWKGLKLPIKLDPNNKYESEMLKLWVKYVRICKRTGKNKDQWYVQLSLKGTPTIKCDENTGKPIHPIGNGAVGIDIGPQTLAYSSQNESGFVELADKVQNIEQKKRLIQRKLDRSRRAMNPENYASNGTIRRGVKLTRNKSKRYCKLQHELAYLQHLQADIRKRQHIELANHLLSLGDQFYIEEMNWEALSHRAKETAVSEKTGRYKRKKRFGKSIANKAPSMFTDILKQKCNTLGLPGVSKIDTKVKASQYNHITKTYEKKALSQRWNIMPDGKRIQRDLYSAFLLEHMLPNKENFDQTALENDYIRFVKQHDEVIHRLESAPKTITSMGIKRTAS